MNSGRIVSRGLALRVGVRTLLKNTSPIYVHDHHHRLPLLEITCDLALNEYSLLPSRVPVDDDELTVLPLHSCLQDNKAQPPQPQYSASWIYDVISLCKATRLTGNAQR